MAVPLCARTSADRARCRPSELGEADSEAAPALPRRLRARRRLQAAEAHLHTPPPLASLGEKASISAARAISDLATSYSVRLRTAFFVSRRKKGRLGGDGDSEGDGVADDPIPIPIPRAADEPYEGDSDGDVLFDSDDDDATLCCRPWRRPCCCGEGEAETGAASRRACAFRLRCGAATGPTFMSPAQCPSPPTYVDGPAQPSAVAFV